MTDPTGAVIDAARALIRHPAYDADLEQLAAAIRALADAPPEPDHTGALRRAQHALVDVITAAGGRVTVPADTRNTDRAFACIEHLETGGCSWITADTETALADVLDSDELATHPPTTVRSETLIRSWLDREAPGHRGLGHCPGCSEDVTSTIGITQLAYAFVVCRCDQVDHPHLVEQLHHLECLLTRVGPDLVARELLDAAAGALEPRRRTTHRDKVRERISRWLAAIPTASPPADDATART